MLNFDSFYKNGLITNFSEIYIAYYPTLNFVRKLNK